MKTENIKSVLESLVKDCVTVKVSALSSGFYDTYEICGTLRFGGANRFSVNIPDVVFPTQARAYFRAEDVTKIEIQPNSLFGTDVHIRVRHKDKPTPMMGKVTKI